MNGMIAGAPLAPCRKSSGSPAPPRRRCVLQPSTSTKLSREAHAACAFFSTPDSSIAAGDLGEVHRRHDVRAGDAGDVGELLQHLDADPAALAPSGRRPSRGATRWRPGSAVPKSFSRIHRAERADGIGATPMRIGGLESGLHAGAPRIGAPRRCPCRTASARNRRRPRALARSALGSQSGGGSIGTSAAPRTRSSFPSIARSRGKLAAARACWSAIASSAPAVEVVHRLRVGLVAGLRIVAGEHQDVADAERCGAEDVALQREAVAVAAGHLEDRLDAVLNQEVRGGEAGQVHLGARAVGDVDRGGEAFQRQRAAQELGRVGRDRRRDLRGDDEIAAAQPRLRGGSADL